MAHLKPRLNAQVSRREIRHCMAVLPSFETNLMVKHARNGTQPAATRSSGRQQIGLTGLQDRNGRGSAQNNKETFVPQLSKKILIVDDEEIFAENLQAYFHCGGLCVGGIGIGAVGSGG